jgi:Flp pilus assembly protein TadD
MRRAIADLDEVIRLQPENAKTYSYRAGALREIGEHMRALADFNEALRLDPKNPEILANRGLLYMMMSDAKHARADFNSVLALPLSDKWAYDTAREGLGFLK